MHKKTDILRYFLIAMACFTLQQQVAGVYAAEGAGPNIIFILTDDQAPWALGISGDPNARTPNMDRLARQGAYLRNAFVTTPVCSPSRASIMTSRYASEYGILDFIPNPGHKLYDPEYHPGLDPGSITFAEVLNSAGYRTGLVGKWHLGDWTVTKDKKFHPTNHGFDYFAGLTGGGASPENPLLEVDGEVKEVQGLTTDILTDFAIRFIERNSDRKFLLCLNTRAPHGRWLPVADSDWQPYEGMDPYLPNPGYPDLDTERVKREMREYLASTRGVDRNLGRIIAVLDELELSGNTVIIFFSDHGYNMGHNGIKHKGNGIWVTRQKPPDTENISGNYRPNMYDNSLKVPAFIYWPGVIEPGTILDETVTSLDLYPTILDLAGAALPEKHKVRGRSIVPLLLGENIPGWDNDCYAEYTMINYCKSYMRCYRTPEWKLVIDLLDPGRNELYHIALDPEENINLIGHKQEETEYIIKDLSDKIRRRMEDINDPLLKNFQ